ncbi:MAG: WG repeat-containing protein [Bacteroidales bacterium]|nr:WG repeat-containing protein [Bacteroidales bacterium]
MKKLILAIATLSLMFQMAQAQDLKPKKDKVTKKYGYVDKNKNFVIAPQFDDANKFKDGRAIVKNNKRKGVIDEGGNIVIPIENDDISLDRSSGMIAFKPEDLWGAVDWNGGLVFEPQFYLAPMFYSDGKAIVTEPGMQLKGIVYKNGETLLPCEYLGIKRDGNGFKCLDTMMGELFLDANLNRKHYSLPVGAVRPYWTGGDDVIAIAYGHYAIGERRYRNSIRTANFRSSYRVNCTDLLDAEGNEVRWGDGRFVRLILAEDPEGHPGSMRCCGKTYTVKAELCAEDGENIGYVSNWGSFTGKCEQGYIYRAEDNIDWIILKDINAIDAESYSMNLVGYREIDNRGDIKEGLDLSGYEIAKIGNWRQMNSVHRDILLNENACLGSYQPLSSRDVKGMAIANRYYRSSTFLNTRYYLENVGTYERISGVNGHFDIEMDDDPLTITFQDNYSGYSVTTKKEDEIFFGQSNDRYIKIELVPERISRSKYSADPFKYDGIWDDKYQSDYGFKLILTLNEADGRYVRTLGEARRITFANYDFLVIADLHLVLSHMPIRNLIDSRGRIRYDLNGDYRNTLTNYDRVFHNSKGAAVIPIRKNSR